MIPKYLTKTVFMSALAMLIFQTCSSQQFPGYEKTASGIYYKYFNKGTGQKPTESDMVTCLATYSTGDTVFFDSRKSPSPYIFPVMKSTYNGDIFEGIKLMGVGDSISLILGADSLFLKTFRVKTLPKYVKPGGYVYANMKLLKIQPRAEFEKEQKARMEQEMKKNAELEKQESDNLKKYLDDNKITTQPTASGLIYIETKAGTGVQAENGKTVKVHYTGTFLDGKKFDSSLDRGQPIEFQLGKGMVIKGWDEGIAKMKVGAKAKMIIPYKIAYGERGRGNIPPFATLIFDVELVDVK